MPLNLQPATDAVTAQLQRIAADANATLAVIADAVRRLDDAQAGYPTAASSGPAATMPTPHPHGATGWACPARGCATTGTDGASWPAHWQDEHGPLPSTQPERHALAGHDDAATDTTALLRDLRRAGASILAARRTAEKWGVTKIGAKTTTTPRDDAWCTSCRRANHFTPRRPEGGPDCRWCADTLRNLNSVLSNLGLPPVTAIPIAAVEKHASGRRVTAADLEGWAKTPTQPRRRSPRTQRAATRALRTGRTEQ